MAPYLLPAAVENYATTFPEVELIVREDVTEGLVAAAAAGEIDVGIAALPLDESRLSVEVLLTGALSVVLPASHPLEARSSISLSTLRSERLLVLADMHCLGAQTLDLCKRHEFHPRVSFESSQLATVQGMVSSGQGITLLPALARLHDDSADRVCRRVRASKPRRTWVAFWNRHRHPTAAHSRFVGSLRQVVAEMRERLARLEKS